MNSALRTGVIVETERLVLREVVESDAVFINDLLNTPSFLRYIGDRGVRSAVDAEAFIRDRYRQSYVEHGYGLFVVELRGQGIPVGVCGFVRRETLPGPDIGFAFLPEHEGQGYGFESAKAILDHGIKILGFDSVFAITSIDNDRSGRLLAKLGFDQAGMVTMPDGEDLKLFVFQPAR